jgi:UDP-N-acetylglucosamine 3-dehydrogenase
MGTYFIGKVLIVASSSKFGERGGVKRIGIVGAGLTGNLHAERWTQLLSDRSGRLELAGFYTRTPARAQAAAERYGGRAFPSLEALLSAVDVVDVCTPTPSHKDLVLAAAAAGKDIICEKPMARHLRDAQEMVAACEAAGVRLFPAHVVRFFPEYARAKEILDSGRLGRPGVIRTVRGGNFPAPDTQNWYIDFAQGGGVILDMLIHDIDYAGWCFGRVARVFARGLTFSDVDDADHVLLTVRFENGAVGHLEGSWAYPPGNFRIRLEIAGDRGLLEVDSLDKPPMGLTLKQVGTELAAGVPVPESSMHPTDDPYYREIAHFVACLESGDDFLVSAQDGLEALRIALAAIESLRIGQPVDVRAFEGETHP